MPLQGGSQQIKKPFYSVLLKKKNRTQARYGLHDLGPVPGTGILLDAISLLNLYRVTDLPTALSPVAIPVSQYKVPTVSSNKTKTVVYKRFTAGLPPPSTLHTSRLASTVHTDLGRQEISYKYFYPIC